MLPVFSCLFLLLGQSLASPSSNQYVDNVIHNALQNVIYNENLDPTFLPDYTFEYKDKLGFMKVKGKAEYTEGTLKGLSKVQRYSECQGPRNDNGRIVINCTLTFNSLETTYKGRVKYGVLPKVTINGKGTVQYTLIDAQILQPLNQRAQVTFHFRSVGSMKTDFSGLGPLNGQMKVLEENYRGRVGSEVVNVINNKFRYAFETAATQIPIPFV